MKLSELLAGVETAGTTGFEDREISGVSVDSRMVKKGDIFIAVKGHNDDGHNYAAKAEESGAAALVAGRKLEAGIPVIVVENPASAAALLARNFYGDPASGIVLVGITGTNGKTSTSFLIKSILDGTAGLTGVIGTVGAGTGTVGFAGADNTTPGAVDIYRILAGFVGEGCRAAVMEVSSHAAVQGRIDHLEFDVAVFTNITRDHLDYHGSFENYVAAKELLTGGLTGKGRKKQDGVLVYNLDDKWVEAIGNRFKGKRISYGFGGGADVRGGSLSADLNGTRFTISTADGSVDIELSLLGSFSAYNALAAAGAALATGAGLESIKSGLERVEAVPGRFQVVGSENGPTVIIDYAHTPDALRNLLVFCRELSPRRLITLFGCGGDRDRGKRPMMGKLAAELSDRVYVTSDNPRTEDPDAIIRDILEGLEGSTTPVIVEVDRKEAIARAVADGGAGELVVLAGKGHEDYQIIGATKIALNDLEEARKALGRLEVGDQN